MPNVRSDNIRSFTGLDTRYLKLDQTTPQTIANGVPLMTTAVDEYGSGNQLVNMDYVNSGTWLMPPIIEWYDPTGGLPVDPGVGDRYGADATAEGWTIDYIYEWDGDEWVETAPEEGWMLWDLFGLIMWVFFSGGWMEMGSDSYLKLDASNDPVTGAIQFQNDVDSTTAFQVLDADGGTPILNVDTTNERVGIGTATPKGPFSLLVNGGIRQVGITQNSNVGGTATMEFQTEDGSGNMATRILMRGDSDNMSENTPRGIEFYTGASGSERLSFAVIGGPNTGSILQMGNETHTAFAFQFKPDQSDHFSMIPGANYHMYFWEDATSGKTKQLRLYGYPTDGSLDYATIKIYNATTTNDLEISTNKADSNILLLPNKNVGIGETSPLAKLEVNGDVLVKDKISFTQDDKNEFIDSLADGYMDYRATTAHRIGDAANYTEIKSDGEILRHGTARTTNAVWIDAGGIKAPGSKPATYISHGLIGVWQFADQAVADNQEHVSSNMRIPHRADRGVALELIVGWSAAGANPGDCEWQLEYVWRSPNEDTTAAAQETLTTTTAASATANGVTQTTFTGIDLPSATDGGLYFRITRLSAGANDTIADTVELSGIMLKFTSDKLGTGL